jgi:pantothenate kinase-related protein Tda10
MKTPAQYQHELTELTSTQPKDLDESAQKEWIEKLTHLENLVALDLRSLSVQFQARAISQLNNSNFKAGKGKATAEKQLLEDQNSKLKPYQDILEKIKELVKKPE